MDKIEQLLNRGVDKIYPSKEELEQILRSGKKLKLYQGFDPTGTKLHIGHLVGLRKLADWQALGHEVIFLIGDGTGQAGDPSGKTRSREKFLSRKELRKNAKDYVKQAGKILKFSGKNKIRVLFNGDWLNKLKLPDILNIAGNFSWQQLSERDLFQERISKGEALSLREALYPLLQAYDSVAMSVDLEVGGSDQTFNMLFGRSLLKSMKGKDKFVMTTPLLTDSSGRKIGKTEGNVIAIDDKPEDLFGKIMTFPDEVIVKCFEYLTRIPMSEVKNMESKITGGENPMPYKKILAFELVKDLHGEVSAKRAQLSFESAFQKKEIPNSAREVESKMTMLETLVSAGAVDSSSAGRRLFDAGAVTDLTADKKVLAKDSPKLGHIYKIGKHTFIKIR